MQDIVRFHLVRRSLLRLAGALAVFSLAACMHAADAADADVSTTRLSERGAYRVSYASDTLPIPINRLHRWTVHVEDKGGQPVTDAMIKVDGDMPGHGHGLPTRPRVTQNLGNGDYVVEGMKFQMGGRWVMEVTVAAGAQADTAKFNLELRK
jgi:YtkA-like protein